MNRKPSIRFALAFAKLLARLPLRFSRQLTGHLAQSVALRSSKRTLVARTNIQAAFSDWDNAGRQRLLKQSLFSTGAGLAETAFGFWANDARVKSIGEVRGLEHLRAALKAGNGVIVVTGHFSWIELAARMLNVHLQNPVRMLARRHADPVVAAAMTRARENHCETEIEKKDMRGMIKMLRAGKSVFFAPDQNFSYRCVFVPFFGIQAATVTALADLSKRTGAAIVPMWGIRDEDGKYQVELQPKWELFPSGDAERDAARFNRWLEHQIIRQPESYLWEHRRFRNRPEGEPEFYPKTAMRDKHR